MISTRAQVLFTVFMLFMSVLLMGQSQAELVFSAENDSVEHPVQLPPQAMTLLVNDKQDFPDGPPHDLHCNDKEKSVDNWEDAIPQILCTKLPLSSASDKDYLVIGVGGLRGAHIIPFWIIHQSANGATLLFKDRSDDLTILPNRYHGYRKLEVIRVFQAGAIIVTDRYRFDGSKYVRFSSHETHN
jgi:hypothetical protein